MSVSKVDLYAAIRRDHRGGMSQRALQRKYNVTWRTVRRALDGQWPEPRRQQGASPASRGRLTRSPKHRRLRVREGNPSPPLDANSSNWPR
jgi:hypothetical protein